MSSFKPRWMDSPQMTPDGSLTILTKAPSVSSVSTPRGVVQGQKPRKWDDAEIYRDIQLGKPVRIWSTVLKDWVYWVRDNRIKESVERKEPRTAAYTLAEIQGLISKCCGSEQLRKVHQIKKIMAHDGFGPVLQEVSGNG